MNYNEIMFAKKNGTIEQVYECLVDSFIAKKYPLRSQIAIIRQKDEKPEEFEEFYAFAEQCKAEAKAYIENPPQTQINVSKVVTAEEIAVIKERINKTQNNEN